MKRIARGVGVLAVLFAAGAHAQPSSGTRFARPPPPVPPPAPAERSSSLEGHLALSVAERLLASDDSDERVRGVERLVASEQREGIDRLVRALTDGNSTLRDPRARLTAVRALFPYASRELVRQAMEKALSTDPGSAALVSMARDTAAMALAASDDARSLDVLRKALLVGGPMGDAAARALYAYPPASLVPLGVGGGELPAPVCDVLGRLGDERAVSALRGTLVRGLARSADSPDEIAGSSLEEQSRQAKVAAALALARLGDQEQVPVARAWASSSDAWLRLKGAEILLVSGASDARRALLPLLVAPGENRAEAFRLATRAPGADLVAAAGEAAKGSDESGRLALVLLGRVGGASAVSRLEALLRDPAKGWDAAFALARAPGDEARRALEGTAPNAAFARLVARAGVVRALSLGDEPRRLRDNLRSLFSSKDAADRAAGAFGLAALGETSLAELVNARDSVVVRAAARASLAIGRDAAKVLAPRLASENDTVTRSALAIALLGSSDAIHSIPTYKLLSWADGEEPLAPLAIVALGAREQRGEAEQGEGDRLSRWLESEDPVTRTHAAYALGQSPLANATGRLARAWRFEPDRVVRRAIVVALAQRGELARRALDAAARLDPDAEVRESAALGLAGRLPSPLAWLGNGCARAKVAACYVAWISLSKSAAARAESVDSRPATFVDASGLALPVVTDPDGAMLLPGVSSGEASFRLASSLVWYEALGHDRGQQGSGK
jgi:HEAT repeat protein